MITIAIGAMTSLIAEEAGRIYAERAQAKIRTEIEEAFGDML